MAHFKERNTIGIEELTTAQEVVKSGQLSDFIGAWHQQKFFGGNYVRLLEQRVCDLFAVKHAIAVNSWTSGLIAIIGSLGLEPGDEIITTPWTMSATAMAILHNNCIPVFADIDARTYNIDPDSVSQLITSRTKAILAVDIFGLSADVTALRKICDTHNLYLISDSAQAPGATVANQHAGTIADIGGFSFNYHKHIHCGEGGVIVTNDDHLAIRCRLLRNHAESVVKDLDFHDEPCMVGYNFRMTELEAAIAYEQLPKLQPALIEKQKQAQTLFDLLTGVDGLLLPEIPASYSHVYYIFGIQLACNETINLREKLVQRLGADFPLIVGYQNIHRLPVFQNKKIYRESLLPWSLNRNVHNYHKGCCPVAERLFDHSFVGIPLCQYDFSDNDIKSLGLTFKTAWESIHGSS